MENLTKNQKSLQIKIAFIPDPQSLESRIIQFQVSRDQGSSACTQPIHRTIAIVVLHSAPFWKEAIGC